MSDVTARWLEAGRIASLNPRALILCPSNLDDHLAIFDVTVGDRELSRYLVCPRCHARNVLRITDIAHSGAAYVVVGAEDSSHQDYSLLELVEMTLKERERASSQPED